MGMDFAKKLYLFLVLYALLHCLGKCSAISLEDLETYQKETDAELKRMEHKIDAEFKGRDESLAEKLKHIGETISVIFNSHKMHLSSDANKEQQSPNLMNELPDAKLSLITQKREENRDIIVQNTGSIAPMGKDRADQSGGFLRVILLNELAEHVNRIEDKLTAFESRVERTLIAFATNVKQTLAAHLEESLSAFESRIELKYASLKTQIKHTIDTMEHRVEGKLSTRVEKMSKLDDIKHSLKNLISTEHAKNAENVCRQGTGVIMNFLEGKVVPKMDQLWNELEARTNQLQQTMNYPEVFRKGGWTTIQHRFSGALDFNRSWLECAEGFGDVGGEFWFGLEKLHRTVRDRKHELLVVLEDFDGVIKYAHYSDFRIGNEEERYKIKRLGRYSGTAGDSLRRQKSAQFATYDKPQPGRLNRNCAESHKGPWWCKSRYSQSNLNGKFPLWRTSDSATNTMHLLHLSSEHSTIKSSKMMIRPSD